MELASFYNKIIGFDCTGLKEAALNYENNYRVLNQRIKFKSNSPILHKFLAHSFSCFSQVSQDSNIEFKFIEKGPLSSRFVFTNPLSTHFLYQTDNGIISIYQENRTQAPQIAYLGESPEFKPSLDQLSLLEEDDNDERLYSIIEFLVTTALINLIKRHFFFHAASLAWQGRGVMLAGETMKGKTTLSLCLAHHGFEFLSDDIACLNPTTQKLIPFPQSLNLREKSLPLLPYLFIKNEMLVQDASGKRRLLVKAADIGIKVAKGSCRPRYIFLLKGFNKKPKIKEASPREALWYAFSSSYARISDPPQMLFTLSPIFDRLKCYHLWPGKVKETVDLIQELVSE